MSKKKSSKLFWERDKQTQPMPSEVDLKNVKAKISTAIKRAKTRIKASQ